MFNQSWFMLTALIWLWTCCFNFGINGQSQNAIGAHRVFQKTSFSCTGRPSGYYADIETGCQIYHMCDGLGRQFSYSCPNTTLFQQRMLICDHWYMVNCSKAESNYAANLLIGQRDKPFVNDEENSLRTPRPDLLDRPYAPDYSGESFRNQYKQIPALQNQIRDSDSQKNVDKTVQVNQISPGQQRWKIPPPSRTIQPPAFEAESTTTAKPLSRATDSVRFVATTKTNSRQYSSTTTRPTTRRPVSPAPAPPLNRKPNTGVASNNGALHQRRQESLHGDHEDLGTSHSTRYNTSADYNSAETPFGKTFSRKSFNGATGSTSTTKQPIKVPSKIYEPPFLYPIYNQDETPSTETPLRVSTATPFKVPTATYTITSTTTTSRPPSRPTTLAGKPFTVVSSFATPTTSTVTTTGRNQNNFQQTNYQQNGRTPTPAQGFKARTTQAPVNTPKTLRQPSTADESEASALDYKVPTTSRLNLPTPLIGGAVQPTLPANDLLPPFQDFIQRDIATTQGPPIYYQWKLPSDGLEPPKLDPPIGVDGREYPETVADYNSISSAGGFTAESSFGIDQQKTAASSKTSYSSNPFLPKINNDSSTSRTPSSRSIKETGQPNSLTRSTAGKSTTRTAPADPAPSRPTDISQLRKDLSLPDYAFPLESIGRTGYLSADTYNSFQLKIPERRTGAANDHQHWFGENPKCPECHPSYVIPGTCEPCLRR